MIYLRGDTYWYRFRFQGIQIRQSTKSTNKEVADRLYREHRRRLELGQQGLEEIVGKPLLFRVAANAYIKEMQIHWEPATLTMHNNSMKHLLPFFGALTLHEITAAHINKYQRQRLSSEKDPENSTVNRELATVRQVMRRHKVWAKISDEVRMLRENEDVGQAVQDDGVIRLLNACKQSLNPALYTAVLVSIHTGLRSHELRLLKWNQIDFKNGKVTVGKSKTEAGRGRDVYLSGMAQQVLKDWQQKFPKAGPKHYIFPNMKIAVRMGGSRGICSVNLEKPTQRFQSSWKKAKQQAGVQCRWHDLRHTALSTVRESGASDQTVKAMFGWVSNKMMERYSHARVEAKRAAVAIFDRVGTI